VVIGVPPHQREMTIGRRVKMSISNKNDRFDKHDSLHLRLPQRSFRNYSGEVPKISETTRLDRRNHVLVSAWKCFSRQGFHATSMDEIIAETGMSSSSVYRYFRSKEELIDAAAEESLSRTYLLLTELTSHDPVPSPAETLAAMLEALRQRQQADYDLTKIAMTAWAEALRRPEMHRLAYHFYAKVTGALTALAQRWKGAGYLPKDADPAAIAALFVTLMPGFIVMSHLYELPGLSALSAGIADFASAPSTSPPPDD
jgi:AcrR family transcriptional regulator